MKSVSRVKNKINGKRILAVDPASHSMALALIEVVDGETKIVYTGKMKFPQFNDMATKQATILSAWPRFFAIMGPIDQVIIEQSIYIQNPQTSRILAYLTGALWQASIANGAKVVDVPPMTWKSWVGYKRIMPAEKKKLIAELGEKEAKKVMASERKERVKKILEKRFPEIESMTDYDIIDAIGIGIWGAESGSITLQGN
jgi:Holliday junction resolvasome RuvABC endonuclease subunit